MSAISKFYSGRSIFITGGTGFIGKLVVEKLLRSCSEIDRIYLLMRPKKGVPLEERISQTIASPVFERLRHAQPDFRRKLYPIGGDVAHDLLGISDRDRKTLEDNVSLVIHSAATLNMMEPLKDAVNMNLLGVRRMLNLCKQLPNLEGLVHISTAFTQVDRKNIKERLYEPPLSPSRLIDMTTTLNTEELAELTPYLLRKHARPNTYALTKAVAERLIVEEKGDIPMSIFRPSIVGASLNEPMPGWLENYSGLTGIYTGIATGFIRSVLTDDPICIDVIPVDLTANAVIALCWKTALDKPRSEIPIYHYTSGALNYCSIAQYRLMILKNVAAAPFTKIPGRRSVFLTNSQPWVHQYYIKAWLPIRFEVTDKMLQLAGRKPMMMKMFNQSKKLQSVLDYFTSNSWNWQNDNILKIYENMTDTDRKEFNFDIKTLDWHDYFEKYWYGIKKYLFKVPDEELTPATQDVKVKTNLRRAFYSSIVLVSLMTPYYVML